MKTKELIKMLSVSFGTLLTLSKFQDIIWMFLVWKITLYETEKFGEAYKAVVPHPKLTRDHCSDSWL